MNKFSLPLCVGLAVSVALTAANPKEGGVCFRFDDNKPIENWQDMAKIFESNNARFGMSIIPQKWWQPNYPELLRDMQKREFEIMDHTPDHALFYYNAPNDTELNSCKKIPSFDHADKHRVFFKYLRNPDYPGTSLTVDLKGNSAVNPRMDQKKKRLLSQCNFLYNPETRQAWRFTEKNNILTLNSFWNEKNVNLPEMKNVKLELVPNAGGFNVPEDALKLRVESAQKYFKAIGLKLPVTFIQPGGMEPVPDAKNIGAVYSKYGYSGGATYPNNARRSYNEPNPSRQRFAMMWGQFNLEGKTVADIKTKIAETFARHQVAIGSSHMNIRNVPGGWKEYLARHDELLKWCNAKKIPIRLQKEWCKRLYDEKPDPAYNIMPSPAVDLDENGTPDAYQLYSGTKAVNGILKVPKSGRAFEITGLCGAERGKNIFSFEYKTAGTGTVSAELSPMIGNWNVLKKNNLKVQLKPGEFQTFRAEFDVPENTETLRIDFRTYNLTAPLEIRNLSITGK